MRTVWKIQIFVFIISCLFCSSILSQTLDIRGQLSSWLIFSDGDDQFGIRYIPCLSIEKSLKNDEAINLEMSLNTYRSGQFHSINHLDSKGEIKPYRLWLRFAGSQFETRIGLQKINFGAATLLRPLMWFDRIDPRDPLQITDGVYGALFRYYFLNNANIWLWGLYDNEAIKGWELIPTVDKSIEYGGRFQHPLFNGEMAFTFHHRRIDLNKGFFGNVPIADEQVPENRFAVDGKWDVGIGLWFESVLIHQKSELLSVNYQKLLNVGLDYTFGLGNGLHLLGEHLFTETSKKIFEAGEQANISSILLDYPLDLIDQLMGILYYDWKNHDLYRFLSWQRRYDNWSFYVFGFWNPEQNQLYQNQTGSNPFAGKGFQVMVVFNH